MIQQKIAIPTYFKSGATGNADWSEAERAGKPFGLLGIVVFNPASGPGYTSHYLTGGTKHGEYLARINQMQAAGADVVGYVTTNYRDSRGTTVQPEHRFTVDPATDVVTTRTDNGAENETGWPSGFGPIRVRSDSTLPGGLADTEDYFWIVVSSKTGKFATSRTNAINGVGIDLTSTGDEGASNNNHGVGLSRNLANIANVFFEIDEFYARWQNIDGIFSTR